MDQGIENLKGVARTLVVPLQARAMEARRPDAIIRDELAQQLLDRLGFEFDDKFNRAWFMHLAISIRTRLIDDACLVFLKDHPEGLIVNLGCGLDARFSRIDNGRVRFYEIDLPEVIELRKRLFSENGRDQMVSRSVLDFSWADDLPRPTEPALFIAEGLLYYLEEKQNRDLLDMLVNNFPGSEMIIDMFPPILIGRSAGHHPSLKAEGFHPQFKWGLKNSLELESWNPKIKFVQEWRTMDFYKKRWKWMRFFALFPALKKLMSSRIVRIKLG